MWALILWGAIIWALGYEYHAKAGMVIGGILVVIGIISCFFEGDDGGSSDGTTRISGTFKPD